MKHIINLRKTKSFLAKQNQWILFGVITLCLALNSFSQNYLGYTKTQIIQAILADPKLRTYEFDKSNAGVTMITTRNIDNDSQYFYFLNVQDTICAAYITTLDDAYYPQVMKMFNDPQGRYEKIDEYHFLEYGKAFNTLWTVDRQDKFFAVIGEIGNSDKTKKY